MEFTKTVFDVDRLVYTPILMIKEENSLVWNKAHLMLCSEEYICVAYEGSQNRDTKLYTIDSVVNGYVQIKEFVEENSDVV